MHSFVSIYYNIGANIINTISLYEMNNKIVTRIAAFADTALTTSSGVAVLNMGENDVGD